MPNLSNQVYTYYVTLTDFTQLQNFVKLCHKFILLLAKKVNFSWIQFSDMNSFYGFKWTCFGETSCGIVVFVIILVEYLQNIYIHFHIIFFSFLLFSPYFFFTILPFIFIIYLYITATYCQLISIYYLINNYLLIYIYSILKYILKYIYTTLQFLSFITADPIMFFLSFFFLQLLFF